MVGRNLAPNPIQFPGVGRVAGGTEGLFGAEGGMGWFELGRGVQLAEQASAISMLDSEFVL